MYELSKKKLLYKARLYLWSWIIASEICIFYSVFKQFDILSVILIIIVIYCYTKANYYIDQYRRNTL